MQGDLRLRVGTLEGGFAADGSEDLPNLSKHQSLAAEVLSKIPDLYDRLKGRQTKLNIRLARCIKAAVDTPDSTDACLFAGDEDCFDEFAELFDVVIARMHGLLPAGEVSGCQPKRPAVLSPVKPAGKRLDPSGGIVHSVQLRAARNLRGVRFLPAMDRKEKTEVEMLVARAVRGLAPAVTGVYFPLRQSLSYGPRAGGMDEFEEQKLKAAGLHFDLSESEPVIASGTCRDWPHGRGIFTSSDRKLAVWINQQEHITLMTVGEDLYVAYREMQRALDGLGEILRRRQPGETQAFAWSERLGYLTSNLHGLGCSLEAAVILKLPQLTRMEVSHPSSAAGSWRAWAGVRRVKVEQLSVLDGRKVEGCFRICNMDTFNMSEGDVLNAVHEVASRLVFAEQKIQTMSDSDELFPLLTSVLSTEEPTESQSLMQVFSLAADGNEQATQEAAAQLMKQSSQEELNELKNRVKTAMISKLHDGSLEEVVESAACAAGAQHFTDLPPPPPPREGQEGDDLVVDAAVSSQGQRIEVAAVSSQAQRTEELGGLRLRTADLLAKAAEDGELLKILQEVKKEMCGELRGRVAGLLAEAAETGHLGRVLGDLQAERQAPQDLRKAAAELLTQAAENGQLERLLAERSSKKEPSVELRKRAADLLTQAADNGSLERVLAERSSKKEPSADIRKRAADLLTQAAENGSLEKVLAERSSKKEPSVELRKRAADLLTQAAENGSLERVLVEKSRKKDPSTTLRAKAADLLTQAAENGSLERVLAERSSKKEPSADLRKRAADLLTQAAENGSLQRVLAERSSKKEPSVELRKRAADLLTQAAENGSLERILVERSSKKEPSADLRKRAADLLTQAADNGSLDRVLKERSRKKEPPADLRKRAADLLTQAADNGSLEKVLAERSSKKEPSADLRKRAADLLTQAVDDGSLEKILQSKSEEQQSRFKDDLAGIRQAARDSLLEAAENGSLEKVVSELKAGKEKPLGDAARQKAADLLVKAADSGELQAALQEVANKEQSIRQRAAKALDEAAESGKLQEVLESLKAPRQETLEQMQKQTADLLAQAAGNGELERILAEICRGEAKQPAKQTVAEDMTSVRLRVQHQLQAAAADGRLEQALKMVTQEDSAPKVVEQPGDEADGWRLMLKDQLLRSLDDGSLEKALEEVKKPGEPVDPLRRIEQQLLLALEDGSFEEAVAQEQAIKEAKQAAKEGAFPKALNIEEFSAKMFLEAFSEKGRRMTTLCKLIEEAEGHIKRREQQCHQLQAQISQNKLELAHVQLDLDWHRSALEGAESRCRELQTSQRKLLGALHGKMISDAPAGSSSGAGLQPRPPPRP